MWPRCKSPRSTFSAARRSGTAAATISICRCRRFPPTAEPQIDTTIPAVTAIAETPSTGDLNAGKTVSIMLTVGEAVTVTGTPTLTLSDNGTATYTGISADGKTLTFGYTVGSADTNVASLQVTSINLPGGATIQDGGGNNLNLSLSAVPAYSGPQIDTTIPAVTAIAETPSTGDLNAGKTVSITLTVGEAVTVTGTPTLTLSDNGTATYSRISTDGKALTFSYTVGSADTNVASLQVTSINLPGGATIRDGGGNNLNLSLSAVPTYSGPQIDTTIPAVTAIAETPSTGDLNAGKTVSITLSVGEAVTVTGTPTLTFSYTVGSADTNVASLQVTSINLPGGATIRDGGGNNLNLSLSAVPAYSGTADRHHNPGGDRDRGDAEHGRPQRRQDREHHVDGGRGGDGDGHADAHAERQRDGDLRRHQRRRKDAHVWIHGGIGGHQCGLAASHLDQPSRRRDDPGRRRQQSQSVAVGGSRLQRTADRHHNPGGDRDRER